MQVAQRDGISKIVSVLIIVIIVLGAGLGYEYAANYNQRQSTVTVQNTVTSTKTVTTTLTDVCETSYQNGLQMIKPYNQTFEQVAVFLIKLGSNVQLCVDYPAVKNYVPSTTTTVQFGGNVYNATVAGGLARFFQVVVLPSQIILEGGSSPENSSVIYAATETENVTGFFYLYLAYGCPPAIPLAVGYNASQISSGDFGALYGNVFDTSCIGSQSFGSASIVGSSGVDVTYILARNSTG